MKKFTLLLITILLNQTIIFSQSCLPEGIVFFSQSAVDNFQINYPGCTIIEGDVDITGDISNLNGLSMLTSIEGELWCVENDTMINFNGLNNLESVGGLQIGGFDRLKNFTGLENLSTIGGQFFIGFNDSIIDFSGLNSLTYIGSDINIGLNPNLSNLTGLENLLSTGGNITFHDNDSLSDLTSLENLIIINGSININDNDNLEDLTGIHNISSESIINIAISENDNLSTCEVQSICDYLSDPSGTISISNNETGCNSQSEVETACENVSIEEFISNKSFEIFPNPAKNKLTIRNNKELIIKGINIINQLGEKVYSTKTNVNIIDISKLNTGIYFVEIIAGHNNFRKKLIVN